MASEPILPNPIRIKDARPDFSLVKVLVLEPMTTSDSPGARETGCPDIDMGGAPGTRVCPAIRYSDAVLAWTIAWWMTTAGRAGAGLWVSVLEPMIKAEAEGARDSPVPPIVIGARPGNRVWLPRMYPPVLSGTRT